MADEGLERGRNARHHRIVGRRLGQCHLDGSEPLAVGAIDRAAQMHGHRTDAVAHAQKGKIGINDVVHLVAIVALDPQLQVGLHRVRDVERAAAEKDPGVVLQVQPGQRPGLDAKVHSGFFGAFILTVALLVAAVRLYKRLDRWPSDR